MPPVYRHEHCGRSGFIPAESTIRIFQGRKGWFARKNCSVILEIKFHFLVNILKILQPKWSEELLNFKYFSVLVTQYY
jgi:hypothetical protein